MLEEILKVIPIGLIVLDREQNITFINKKAQQLLNCEVDTIVEGQAIEVFKSTAIYNLLVKKSFNKVTQVSIGGQSIIVQLIPILRKGAKSILLCLIEIEDSLGGECQLQETKAVKKNLEAISITTNDEIFITDGCGILLWLNRMVEKIHGIKAQKLIGRHVSQLEKDGIFPPLVMDKVLKEKRKITLPQKNKNGEQVIVTADPLLDNSGGIVRIVIYCQNISELISLQNKLEETESLNQNYRKMIVHLHQKKLNEEREVPLISSQMKNLLRTVEKVAQVNSTVLITGESGVGKGVFASKIHKLSRPKGPFVQINCGAIPENLLESELFGYEGGAFTGARKSGKKGLVELANEGTLFLDEIAELPLNLQVKLLQVLQERKITRVGGSKQIDINVRVIAATNRDPKLMVAEGKFREDLYYRLNVIPMVIPPLRQRPEDISPLVDYFLNRLNNRYNKYKKISPEVKEIFFNYRWPGNIRELENIVERLFVTTEDNEILPSHIPDYFKEENEKNKWHLVIGEPSSLKEAVEELERQMFSVAYERFKNTYKIADALKVSQSTVVRRLRKYRLTYKNNSSNSKK